MSQVLGIDCSPRQKGNKHALFDSLSSIMLRGVLENIADLGDFTTEQVNIASLVINPCRGCFSDMETRCHFLCDCYDDDFKSVAGKMLGADAVLFATPTYMFGMSSVLKRFFERWISFKAPVIEQSQATKSLDECFDLLEKLGQEKIESGNPLQGKVGGIVVAGSELGQDNVIKEIMLILNLYGFILPPQCFVYHTGHSMQSLEEVRNGFYENQWLISASEHLARSIVLTIELTRGQSWPRMPAVLHHP